MLRIAVCDNEKATTDLLCNEINRFGSRFNIDMLIHFYTNGEKLLCSEKRYDIVLLEIGQHPQRDLYTGFRLRDIDKQVKIILLSYLEYYMREAFQMHAFAYLLKPVSERKLYDVLYDTLSYRNSNEKAAAVIKFQLKNGVRTFAINEIVYFEYFNRSVLIHDCANNIFEIPGEKISNVAHMMKKFNFEVPHKSFVVNLMQIESIKGYEIFMKNKVALPLSQRNSKVFRKLREEFLNETI